MDGQPFRLTLVNKRVCRMQVSHTGGSRIPSYCPICVLKTDLGSAFNRIPANKAHSRRVYSLPQDDQFPLVGPMCLSPLSMDSRHCWQLDNYREQYCNRSGGARPSIITNNQNNSYSYMVFDELITWHGATALLSYS